MKFVVCTISFCSALLHSAIAQQVKDSVSVPASTTYRLRHVIHKSTMGSNYREDWGTPVKMPVFNISKEQGGFRVLKLGGGMQTKSLRLEDKHGNKWVLRTVDKDVSKLFPKMLRRSLTRRMMQDMISASYPYAAMVVAPLADAMGIAAPHPRLFYVPGDTLLGEYREAMGGRVCFLEERSPTHNRKSYNIDEVKQLLQNDSSKKHIVLQKEMLKARLLDMLIADWDRHEGQYRFGIKDSAGKKYIYPVPVDRDQAFFKANGVFAGIAKLFTPFMQGFNNHPGNLKKLSHKARAFDKLMLSGLTAADWKNAIATIQRTLTDSVIDNAVKQLPPEVYALSGQEIAATLKSRRDALHRPAIEYYQFLTCRD